MTRVPRRWLYPLLALVVVLSLFALYPPAALTQSCAQTLSAGANVASAVSGAAPGSTICLNSGSYGTVTLSGIVKNPRVTIRSTSAQGASFRLTVQSGTNGITIDSVTVTGGTISGNTTRNITIQNSEFTGHMTFSSLANSNVLLDRNTHNDIEGGGQFSSPARLHLSYSSSTHSGVTIQNSLLDGGSSDGVQTGVGVNILFNEFRNIKEGSCGDCHTDAIQLLTASDSVIRGNYIHNVATAIVAFDGVVRATIEDNVVDTGGRPWGIELYSDSNSIVRHNTLLYRANCSFNLPCGTIALDHKSQDPAGRGTIIVDNIATSIATVNGSTFAERRNNLVRSGSASGDLPGSPTYLAGPTPTTWAGFQLAGASLGKGAGALPPGSDVGAQFFGQPTGSPPNAPSGLQLSKLWQTPWRLARDVSLVKR
jgi:hypothetical protein